MDGLPLLAFFCSFVVVGGAVWLLTVVIVDGRASNWPPRDQDPFDATFRTGEDVGYLAGGARRAVEAAVARLRIAGAVTYDPNSRELVPTGQPAPDGTPLSAAVLTAAADRLPFKEIADDERVRAAVHELRTGFGEAWWRLDVPRRHFVYCGVPMLVFAVVSLGCVLLLPPYRWWPHDIAHSVVPLLAGCLGVKYSRTPGDMPTPAERAVIRARVRNRQLYPKERPALLTYGPATAALAVGLYGLTVMHWTDVDLAYASQRPRTHPGDASKIIGPDVDFDVGGCGSACGGCASVDT